MIIMRAAILLLILLVLLFGYELIESIMLKMKKPLPAAMFVITVFVFIFASNCCEAFNDKCLDISHAVLMGIAVALTAAGLLILSRIEKWKASQLTAVSVKECVDTIPAGICFCNSRGLPVLVNTVMEKICLDLLGEYLSDCLELWTAVNEKTQLSPASGRSGPVVQLSDGRVYGFTRYEADIEGKKYYEITATDITSEYTLTQELCEKQALADSINRRLRALNLSIGEAIREKELLQIKISIHDEFGKMLLLTKRSLLVAGSVEQDELLRLWKRNTMLRSNVQSTQNDTPYSASLRHAEKLGVSVSIRGDELPETPELVKVIDEAITAHTTNVVRHAHGSCAFIDVSCSGSSCELCFTNDGTQGGNVRERGGLLNLRRIVESCGGSMEIISGEHFEMILRLPLGKGD